MGRTKIDPEEAIHIKKRKCDYVLNSLNEVHLLPPPKNKGGTVNILIYAILLMPIFETRRQFIAEFWELEKNLTGLRGISETLPYKVLVYLNT